MTSLLVPAAASAPRLPPGPALLAIRAWALLALVPFGSTAAHAEPAGRMGVTSRATVQISVSVAPRLEVSRSAVVTPGGGGGGGTEGFCVWSNSAVGSYSIHASDASHESGGGPVGEGFPFEVQLAGARAGTIPLSLAPGASATGLTAASGDGCRSGRLVIRPAQMASRSPAVRRSGALLLLVAPD